MGKKVTRLYEQFQPQHYDLLLDVDRDAMKFSGRVTIRGKKTGRPSERFTFHQKELKVTSASAIKHGKNGDEPVNIVRINKQASYDEVRLHSDKPIYPGEYTITLEFAGAVTRPMNGIYPCFFKHNGKDKVLIATQFESHHAREAFPCVDEPEAKATFDLTLVSPSGETVIGNTPVKSQKTAGKRQTSIFETTPKMSAYLLAFVYGELGYTASKTKNGVEVRSYATPENVKLTGYSVDVATKLLEFFEDYFGVPYPLPKLDMVALPDFSVGAMENWGLMTFRQTTLLTDLKTSTIESKQLVALVVSHELSHQWFGNLVTMKWWDDLWLNESFANMMEYRAVDDVHPEWHIWEQFISHETTSAKRRDSLADVQPIHTEVRHPDEISTIFDPSIVYAKGGSVLYMLLNHIGEEAFRDGLQVYFKKHAYGNTVAEDLWTALGSSSQQDISTFMEGWLTRPGYPLVEADWTPGSKTIGLSQQRFLNDPAAQTPPSPPWYVPLAPSIELDKTTLSTRKTTVSLKQASPAPLLLNHEGHSYFLPLYKNPAHLQQIIDGLKDNEVSAIDRLLLLDNYTMLQRGGLSSTIELLELLSAYQGETSENVWGAMAGAIGEARKLVETDDANDAKLDDMIRGLVLRTAENLGWDDKPGDDSQTLRLRGLTFGIAAGAKAEIIIAEGLRRFASFKKPGDLSPSTRGVVYFIGARHGSSSDFQKLLKLHEAIQNADEKEEIAAALTATKEPKHYNQLLGLLTTESVRRQDLLHWFAWLLRNRYSRATAWEWMTSRWEWIEKEFSADKNYSYFPRFAGSVFSRKSELKQFNDFFESKKSTVALSRDIQLAKQEINSRIAWRGRNEAAVKTWLKKHSQ
jgi:aminopeptidase N